MMDGGIEHDDWEGGWRTHLEETAEAEAEEDSVDAAIAAAGGAAAWICLAALVQVSVAASFVTAGEEAVAPFAAVGSYGEVPRVPVSACAALLDDHLGLGLCVGLSRVRTGKTRVEEGGGEERGEEGIYGPGKPLL
ncbi:hypothetical protein CC1G_15651 [Coprinopsis cinerea okayama7|uniref:Uncharacterized protein n=1 Tax=Coprinopsis cinerea (strain Okayama-7 / 130 / ATCC MYA-4618 / FGSC 9003) TaxID=240176 RepID=D6RQB2_COPC7|nr:hypothetical protein CC1G_15651 [Coprinopsis cinerea okayama7\|eukprot:XP_002910222.1 hypothetical protein CC1G_15651 [Coprinopsis cinerea okayama7\